MNLRLLVTFCLAVLLSGCGENRDSTVQPPRSASAPQQTQTQAVSASQQTPPPPAAQPASAANDPAAVLGPLTQSLRKYCVEHRTVPGTFEEFAVAAGVRIPPAPPGKKFAIEPKRLEVIIVDR